jgi:hypothetical protein
MTWQVISSRPWRAETIAAEDILHDMGAISIMSSDSQAGCLLQSTRSEPLYSKKLEDSVVSSVLRGLTTDTRPTGFSALSSYSTPNCK